MKTPHFTLVSLILFTACSSGGETVAVRPQQREQSSMSSTSSISSTTPRSSLISSSIASVAVEVSSAKPVLQPPTFDPLSRIQRDELPSAISLDVPFTVQAPNANWDPPFDEACEEASLLTVEYFLRGSSFTPEISDREIRKMVDWETANGYKIDITIAELAEVARKYLDREAAVYTGSDVTIENMKALLAAGYPVIIPAAGQDLGNPYFSGDGPPYHMLVLTGYTRWGNFITNDPGTKRGEDYAYDQDLILSVIHDWNGSTETIRSGQKAMMVLR